MLSRVAESLLWMARYLERADSVSRIVEAIDGLSLDYRHPDLSNEEAFWSSVFDTFLIEKGSYIEPGKEQEILHHLFLDQQNASSVFFCISAARSNARGVRDQLMNEIWEVINDLYLSLRDLSRAPHLRLNIAELGAKVRFSIHCLRGLVESSMKREEAWCFLMIGMKLERADQMTRLMDMKTFMLASDRKQVELLEPYAWVIIMQASGCGTEGFGSANADWKTMEKTLVYDLATPNSIRSCVRKVNQVLHILSTARLGVFANNAERICGRLQADLEYKAFDGVLNEEFHEFLDGVQHQLARVFIETIKTYTHAQLSSPLSQSQSQ